MKRRTLIALLLTMTLLTGAACAQMNYELYNPNLTYEQPEAGEAMPVLVDVLDGEELPEDVSIIGGADGPPQIVVADEPQEAEDVWPKTFTITMAGDTTLGSTDELRKRDDCFERVA